jgi:3,4-dihydroxy-2-butanone 4-phosphate synthase
MELCRLARCEPVGVIAEIIHDDGAIMRLGALRSFADAHGCLLISIEELTEYLASGEADPDSAGFGSSAHAWVR